MLGEQPGVHGLHDRGGGFAHGQPRELITAGQVLHGQDPAVRPLDRLPLPRKVRRPDRARPPPLQPASMTLCLAPLDSAETAHQIAHVRTADLRKGRPDRGQRSRCPPLTQELIDLVALLSRCPVWPTPTTSGRCLCSHMKNAAAVKRRIHRRSESVWAQSARQLACSLVPGRRGRMLLPVRVGLQRSSCRSPPPTVDCHNGRNSSAEYRLVSAFCRTFIRAFAL